MKSNDSRRKTNLKYIENQDFWEFYMANKDDVDLIIEASCRMFQKVVPTEDMKMDILIKLCESEFLNRFDATQAKLNTYITSLVRGHAKNIAQSECPNLFDPDAPFQVLDSDLNEGVSTSLNLPIVAEEVPEEMDVRYLRRLGGQLNDGLYKNLFTLLLQNKTGGEIAKEMGISRPCTTIQCNNLLNKLRGFARNEIITRKEDAGQRPCKENAEPLNKHVCKKVRSLTDAEKDLIRNEFLNLNGIFEESKKDCTRIRDRLSPDISVFQVSTYVLFLHRQVASGRLQVSDRRAYFSALRDRRKHWLTYRSDKYRRMKLNKSKLQLTRKA